MKNFNAEKVTKLDHTLSQQGGHEGSSMAILMKKLTGAEILMECLLEQGVDTVFGYPGGAVLNIYDALYTYSHRILHILTAHEQGAAHAADGYARASGKTGVCIATSGPGATNLVTGIATAFMDSTPMVAITGNVASPLLGLSSFQEIDITGVTKPITKKNYLVTDVTKLAGIVREAFLVANSGRKGPVLIDIPKDITAALCDYSPKAPSSPSPPKQPTKDTFAAALTLLQNSKKPFLYAGGGVILSEASPELHALAERLDAPVSCSLMCQGGFDQDHPRYVGMLGMHGTKTASLVIGECDLLIAVGTRFSDRVTCNTELFAANFPVLQIDIDPVELGKNVAVEGALLGDVKTTLAHLLTLLPQRNHDRWMGKISGWKQEFPLVQTGKGVTPQQILETLSTLTSHNAAITTEVGQHQMWTAQFYRFRRPRQFITSGGLGTMGFGLGACIGAKMAHPERYAINIAGDGSFHMNANELATLAKSAIPVVEIVFDNQVLGMVRQWQKLFYGSRFSHTTMERKTDYGKLAEAYGIKALKIEKLEDVEPVLREALALNEPVLVHCLIDRDCNVLPMVPAGGSVEEPILEME